MRLLVFTSSLGAGGAEKHLVRILCEWVAEGVAVKLVLARDPGVMSSELPPGLDVDPLHGRHTRGAVFALSQRLLNYQPDVVFSIQDHANLVAIAATRLCGLRLRRPKLVVGVQNNIFRDFSEKAPFSKERLLPLLIKRLYHLPDAIVTCSAGVATSIRQALGNSASVPIHAIANAGWDDSLKTGSLQAPNEFPSGAPVVINVARLIPQKDHETFLRAAKIVLSRREVFFVIVGEGPLRETLETRARDLGISDRVRFVGFDSNPFSYMARSQLFVLSSRWEGFGNVIVEAMACGVPVISTDCPFGPAEIISDEEDGLLAPVGDAQALAAAMLRVLDDIGLSRRLQQAGYAKALRFSAAASAKKYIEVFHSLS